MAFIASRSSLCSAPSVNHHYTPIPRTLVLSSRRMQFPLRTINPLSSTRFQCPHSSSSASKYSISEGIALGECPCAGVALKNDEICSPSKTLFSISKGRVEVSIRSLSPINVIRGTRAQSRIVVIFDWLWFRFEESCWAIKRNGWRTLHYHPSPSQQLSRLAPTTIGHLSQQGHWCPLGQV